MATLNEIWGTFWSSKRTDRDWQKGEKGKRHAAKSLKVWETMKCECKCWCLTKWHDFYTQTSYCANTVLCQVSAQNKRKESLTRVQTILWKKSPTVKRSVQINAKPGLQNSRPFCLSTLTAFTSLFLNLRLVLERAECTHTWVQPHPAVPSAFSGLSTVNSGTSPAAFSILTWQSRDTLLLISQGLYCFILSHWARLQTGIRCCCSEAPQWHQG